MNLRYPSPMLCLLIITIAIIISIGTIGPVVGRMFTPNINTISPHIATFGGKLVAITTLIQISLLILVLKDSYNNLKPVLFGLIAGFLLILPLGLKEIDSALNEAINKRNYNLSNGGFNTKAIPKTKTLILEDKEFLLPDDIATALWEKFPSSNKNFLNH